jgi:hypothetical protein
MVPKLQNNNYIIRDNMNILSKTIVIVMTFTSLLPVYANCNDNGFKLNYTNLYSLASITCTSFRDLEIDRNHDDSTYFHHFEISKKDNNIIINGKCAQKLEQNKLSEGNELLIELNTEKFKQSLKTKNFVYIKGNIGLKDLTISFKSTTSTSRECFNKITKTTLEKIHVGDDIFDILATQKNNAKLSIFDVESWSQSYGKSVNFNSIKLGINSKLWQSDTTSYHAHKVKNQSALIIKEYGLISSFTKKNNYGAINLFYKIPYSKGIKGCSTNSNSMTLDDCHNLRNKYFNEVANPRRKLSKAEVKKQNAYRSRNQINSYIEKNFIKAKNYCESPNYFSQSCTPWKKIDRDRGYVVVHRHVEVDSQQKIYVYESLIEYNARKITKKYEVTPLPNGKFKTVLIP